MATIKIKNNEFPDLIIMYLMDYLMDNKFEKENETFDAFIEKLSKNGIKPQLLKYYIGLDSIKKSKFKEIKGVFSGKSKRSTINIVKDDRDLKKIKTKNKTIKTIIKKVFSITEKKKKKYHGMPLSDDVIDDIIKKVIQENEENGNILGDI